MQRSSRREDSSPSSVTPDASSSGAAAAATTTRRSSRRRPNEKTNDDVTSPSASSPSATSTLTSRSSKSSTAAPIVMRVDRDVQMEVEGIDSPRRRDGGDVVASTSKLTTASNSIPEKRKLESVVNGGRKKPCLKGENSPSSSSSAVLKCRKAADSALEPIEEAQGQSEQRQPLPQDNNDEDDPSMDDSRGEDLTQEKMLSQVYLMQIQQQQLIEEGNGETSSSAATSRTVSAPGSVDSVTSTTPSSSTTSLIKSDGSNIGDGSGASTYGTSPEDEDHDGGRCVSSEEEQRQKLSPMETKVTSPNSLDTDNNILTNDNIIADGYHPSKLFASSSCTSSFSSSTPNLQNPLSPSLTSSPTANSTSQGTQTLVELPRKIPSRAHPPPGLQDWLDVFRGWSHAERLVALDQLVDLCEPQQVKHVMTVIEPQFQRDFISLLPKELALYVLSFLEPRDIGRAAQTCRYWRLLCEDNLLWKEKCAEADIDEPLPLFLHEGGRVRTESESSSCSGVFSPKQILAAHQRQRQPSQGGVVASGVAAVVLVSSSAIVATRGESSSGSSSSPPRLSPSPPVGLADAAAAPSALVNCNGHSQSQQQQQHQSRRRHSSLLSCGTPAGIVDLYPSTSSAGPHSPLPPPQPLVPSEWKRAYMRQHEIEMNWRRRPLRNAKTLKGHDDHVITCLQFWGNRIVSGSDDNTLKVWSAETGKCLRTLVGHTGGVWSSQMKEHIVISGSTDRTLKVWNAETGQCIHTLYGHTSTVRCMHIHESTVVSGSRDATLRIWNIDSGECLHVLMGHVAAVRCVQYDGKRVISGAYDYMVKVWNPESEECLYTLQGHTNRVYSLQFDGKHIVSGSLDTSIRVWDVDNGNCIHTLIGHQSLTSGMELKNNILVSGNADSTVKVWDIISGQCLQTLSGSNKHQSAVTCLQFTSKFVVTSSDDGTVKLWDLKTGEFVRNLVTLESGGSGGVVWRVRSSPTKLVCAVGSRNGTEETKLLVLDFDVTPPSTLATPDSSGATSAIEEEDDGTNVANAIDAAAASGVEGELPVLGPDALAGALLAHHEFGGLGLE